MWRRTCPRCRTPKKITRPVWLEVVVIQEVENVGSFFGSISGLKDDVTFNFERHRFFCKTVIWKVSL